MGIPPPLRQSEREVCVPCNNRYMWPQIPYTPILFLENILQPHLLGSFRKRNTISLRNSCLLRLYTGSEDLKFLIMIGSFSSTIFKMADRQEKTLGKAGSRGTKSPNILEIFITWHFEKPRTKWRLKLSSKLTLGRGSVIYEAVMVS